MIKAWTNRSYAESKEVKLHTSFQSRSHILKTINKNSCCCRSFFFILFCFCIHLILNVPKRGIPRAKFHEIFLDFVECWIAHKIKSPYFCLKRKILTLKSWNSFEVKLKFHFLVRNTGFPLYGQFNIEYYDRIRLIKYIKINAKLLDEYT